MQNAELKLRGGTIAQVRVALSSLDLNLPPSHVRARCAAACADVPMAAPHSPAMHCTDPPPFPPASPQLLDM